MMRVSLEMGLSDRGQEIMEQLGVGEHGFEHLSIWGRWRRGIAWRRRAGRRCGDGRWGGGAGHGRG
jgi:hypothetical protein